MLTQYKKKWKQNKTKWCYNVATSCIAINNSLGSHEVLPKVVRVPSQCRRHNLKLGCCILKNKICIWWLRIKHRKTERKKKSFIRAYMYIYIKWSKQMNWCNSFTSKMSGIRFIYLLLYTRSSFYLEKKNYLPKVSNHYKLISYYNCHTDQYNSLQHP